jgi:KaiC/GvpD/RAD55 family RecA-like ATPase
VYPTGWIEVDEALDGGIGRQELLQFMANSGVGKSVTMLNLAKNLLKQGLNGIYISLEMSGEKVANRADAMLSGFSNREILEHISEVSAAIINASNKHGRFWIKRMPESTTTSSHIRTYIIEFQRVHGFTPDFIVVDYLDLMTTNKKIALDNLFIKDKYVAEEVRALGLEFDAIMISASQMGRGALEAEQINQGHIQGGISKVNTVDNLIALLQDDMMKAAGEFIMELVKTRNSGGKGTQILLRWNRRTLELTNNVDANGQIIKNTKVMNPVTIPDFVMPSAAITTVKPASRLDRLMKV